LQNLLNDVARVVFSEKLRPDIHVSGKGEGFAITLIETLEIAAHIKFWKTFVTRFNHWKAHHDQY